MNLTIIRKMEVMSCDVDDIDTLLPVKSLKLPEKFTPPKQTLLIYDELLVAVFRYKGKGFYSVITIEPGCYTYIPKLDKIYFSSSGNAASFVVKEILGYQPKEKFRLLSEEEFKKAQTEEIYTRCYKDMKEFRYMCINIMKEGSFVAEPTFYSQVFSKEYERKEEIRSCI